MSTTATFVPGTGLLSVTGDTGANAITVSRNAAGKIFLNGGAIPVTGGVPTVANTSEIEVVGADGDDTIALNEVNGPLPSALLYGGTGDDRLFGGSNADLLFGGDGNDVLNGEGGADQLFGGDGNDFLAGGAGNDQVFGQAGNDHMIWNSGDGSDLLEGGDGADTVQINGGAGAGTYNIAANGTRVRVDGVDPTAFSLDIGTTETLVLHAGDGNDVITAGNGLSTLINLTLDGGAGDDTIIGGDGADMLFGGVGNDTITGGRGSDTAFLGAGNDTYIWNPGDGSDIVEGQTGFDTLLFNGANVAENFDISANGGRAKLTRDVGAVTMDLNQIERIAITTRGGADNIVLHDLTGTGVSQVDVDLAATPGTGIGDGSADNVTIEGRATADHISVTTSGGSILVSGLATRLTIEGAEGANDLLTLEALGGNDTIDASALPAGAIQLTIDGGDGADHIVGSQGADLLLGGADDDTIIGGRGDDTALLGDGNDTYIWNPGDGSDIVEGQAGLDTLQFNGSNAAENIDVSANGSRVRLSRDVGAVVMDLNSVEHIRVAATGGADSITVNDLTGTGVTQVAIDFGAGDGAADQAIINATAGNDAIKIATTAGGFITVNGLAAQTAITNAEAGLDSLTINGLAGNDTIDASGLAPQRINLTINGGDGDDLMIGSAGNDTVIGGRGSDTALLGAGDDTYIWNPGDGSDVVEGQAGFDTLLFNGANVNENINIFANGGRAEFTRDVGAVTMDLNGVERIQFAAKGGADNIVVNDLTGTNVSEVDLDLGSDGQADTITLNATNGSDTISVNEVNGVVTVTGLSALVTISDFDATDRLVINGLGGDDVILASRLGTAMQLTETGGDGDDVLVGSAGNDFLSGGAGNDVLIGNGGFDILDGGTGLNVLIPSNVSNGLAAFAPSVASTLFAESGPNLTPSAALSLAASALAAHHA